MSGHDTEVNDKERFQHNINLRLGLRKILDSMFASLSKLYLGQSPKPEYDSTRAKWRARSKGSYSWDVQLESSVREYIYPLWVLLREEKDGLVRITNYFRRRIHCAITDE
ncbi:hypothetical protein QFC24_004465 [Naganishia onofrii]|uniref:Uncharacterized protein n=1 Tax=Naganishia onofrii TaxID=1851511 RepID=A0ACC2XCV3_9TREE|nr:hypothetical protein QFC24_004465 [Naganishia onofrii]